MITGCSELSEKHGWRQNQKIIGCFCIQYDEMDENEMTRDFIFSSSVVLQGDVYCACKYPKHLIEKKIH
jgi:hypothetical protein